MKKLFLVDAYALLFKYYYAFLGRPMRNRNGMNTSVVFGFVKFLRDIQKRERPDLLGVAFDPKGGSFRREIFPEYKANRSETPEDILISVPYVKRVLEAMCIPILEVEGYEADDVIGTLSQKGAAAGYDVYMVTPDKDYGQLVTDRVIMYRPSLRGEGFERRGPQQVCERYGSSSPQQVSFSPPPKSMQKPYCFAFVESMSKKANFLPIISRSSPSPTVIRCSRFPMKADSFAPSSLRAMSSIRAMASSCA